MTPLPLIDPSLCPVCGQPNQCAMEMQRATGLEQKACWCTHVDFSRELLAKIRPELRGLSCICPRCAQSDAGR
ncbi:MAG: cysteine-rich CWC family protein [Rhizobacter sp.]|nr:cysteine-rich CWC family protein [Rhizobacter sp.]